MQDNWRVPGQPFTRLISGRKIELKALNIEEKATLNAIINEITKDSTPEDVTRAYDAVAECIVSVDGVGDGISMRDLMRVQEQQVMLDVWHELIIGNSLSSAEVKNFNSSSENLDAHPATEENVESGVETKEDAGTITK